VLDIKRYLADEFIIVDGVVLLDRPKPTCPSDIRNFHLITTKTSGILPTIIPRCPLDDANALPPNKNRVMTLFEMESGDRTERPTRNLEKFHWEMLTVEKLRLARLPGDVAYGEAGAVSSCIHDLQLGKHHWNEHLLAIGLGEHQERDEDHALILDTNTGVFTKLEGHTDGVSEIQ